MVICLLPDHSCWVLFTWWHLVCCSFTLVTSLQFTELYWCIKLCILDALISFWLHWNLLLCLAVWLIWVHMLVSPIALVICGCVALPLVLMLLSRVNIHLNSLLHWYHFLVLFFVVLITLYCVILHHLLLPLFIHLNSDFDFFIFEAGVVSLILWHCCHICSSTYK